MFYPCPFSQFYALFARLPAGKQALGSGIADDAEDKHAGGVVAARRAPDQFQGDFVAGAGHAKAGLVQGGDVYAVAEAGDGADFLECRAFVDVVCGENGLGGFDGNRVRIGAVGGEVKGKLAVHIRSDRLHGGQHRGGHIRGRWFAAVDWWRCWPQIGQQRCCRRSSWRGRWVQDCPPSGR